MSVSAGVEHRFGPYGGQYVPETLMPALEELEAAWLQAWRDPAFRDVFSVTLRLSFPQGDAHRSILRADAGPRFDDARAGAHLHVRADHHIGIDASHRLSPAA